MRGIHNDNQWRDPTGLEDRDICMKCGLRGVVYVRRRDGGYTLCLECGDLIKQRGKLVTGSTEAQHISKYRRKQYERYR